MRTYRDHMRAASSGHGYLVSCIRNASKYFDCCGRKRSDDRAHYRFLPTATTAKAMASASGPPPKRLRTDDNSDGDAVPQRDDSFWFEDGNVVIVAQQTAFRVHRGVLSRHSETFSGLFTLPRPVGDAAQDDIEGCPIIRITDSSHDLKHLLHALYDGLGYAT